MSIVNYKSGNVVYHGDEPYEILKAVSLRDVLVKHTITGEQKVLPVLSLRSVPLNAKKDEQRPVEHVDDDHWDEAEHRYKIIKPVLDAQRHGRRSLIKKQAKQYNVSLATIYRYIKQFNTTGTVSALLPKFDLRGKGTSKLPPGTFAIVIDARDNFYLDPPAENPRPTVKEAFDLIKKRCKAANERIPSKGTIYSMFSKIPKSERAKRREGKTRSENIFEAKPGKFPGGYYPLDVVQIDHTPLNVMVVDEEHRESIMRPYLTVAIDVNSRMVFGYYIALEKPGYYSVSQCLTIAFLPKDKFLRSIGVEGQWEIWGKPRLIHADNAWEFSGRELTRVCADNGIILEWRPVKTPHYGGHIERLCGTLNEKIKRIPGTTFSNVKEKGHYDSEGQAVLTLEELEKWFANMVVNEYHNEMHTGIGMTPRKKYELGILGDGDTPGVGLPSALEDEEQLRVSLLPFEERTIRKDGVWIEGIPYWSDVLRTWVNVENKESNSGKFIFKINPKSMKITYFYDPELKRYFPVPYRDIWRPDMTLWQLRAAKKYLREQGIKDYDEAKIFEAREINRKLVDEATRKTKEARRKKSAEKFHERKLKAERDSIAESQETEQSSSATVAMTQKKAVNSSLDELYKDIKPVTGIKILQKKEESR